jgi:hypothetical protein
MNSVVVLEIPEGVVAVRMVCGEWIAGTGISVLE